MMNELDNEALAALAKTGSCEAMEMLLVRNEPFIQETVLEFWNTKGDKLECRGFSEDDLLSAAQEAVWRCVMKYDPECGAAFLTFAKKCIWNTLTSFVRTQKKWLIADIFPKAEDEWDSLPPQYPDLSAKNPEAAWLRKETLREEYEAMQSMSPREREFYYYRNGMDQKRSDRQVRKEFSIRKADLRRLRKVTAEKMWKRLWRYWDCLPKPDAVLAGKTPILPKEYTDGEFLDIAVYLMKKQAEKRNAIGSPGAGQ